MAFAEAWIDVARRQGVVMVVRWAPSETGGRGQTAPALPKSSERRSQERTSLEDLKVKEPRCERRRAMGGERRYACAREAGVRAG